jgi:hypothetical protein
VLLVNRLNHPWHLWLDQANFHAHLDSIQDLGIEVIPQLPRPGGPWADGR